MPTHSRSPQSRMYDYLYEVGSEPDLDSFCHQAFVKMEYLVPDAGMYTSFYLKAPHVPLIRESVGGATTQEIEAYNQYYWSFSPLRQIELTPVLPVNWHAYRHSEFVTDYMYPIDVGHTIFMFILPPGTIPISIAVSRPRRSSPFSDRVLRTLEFLQPHLSNYYSLFSKLQQPSPAQLHLNELIRDCKILTKREAEVALLICRQLTTAEIASKLLVSRRTVEAHVENIKKKLEVRSRKELVVKLLRKNDDQSTTWSQT